MEHLESMEYLRGSVNLRAYGQRDPLTEYRKEGTRLFKELEFMLADRVFQILEGLTAQSMQPAPVPTPTITLNAGEAPGSVSASVFGSATDTAARSQGRNDKVTITNGTETREMKFKKAEPLLTQGWKIVE
jgi:preprotein translocase subunit SecA